MVATSSRFHFASKGDFSPEGISVLIQVCPCSVTSVPGGGDAFCFPWSLLSASVLKPTLVDLCLCPGQSSERWKPHSSSLHKWDTACSPLSSLSWALLPRGSCVVLSARGCLGCQHGASYGSGAGRDSANHSSPLPATLIGSATRGHSRDWQAGGQPFIQVCSLQL